MEDKNEVFGGLKKLISVLGYNGAMYELSRVTKRHNQSVGIDRNSVSSMFRWKITPQKYYFWYLIHHGQKPPEAVSKKYPTAQGTDMSWIKECDFNDDRLYKLFYMS